MAIALAAASRQSPLQLLVEDYLAHCAARGLSPRTLDKCYGYPLRVVFLGWCEQSGITSLDELDGRAVDRLHRHSCSASRAVTRFPSTQCTVTCARSGNY
jgi:hypothetical protein